MNRPRTPFCIGRRWNRRLKPLRQGLSRAVKPAGKLEFGATRRPSADIYAAAKGLPWNGSGFVGALFGDPGG